MGARAGQKGERRTRVGVMRFTTEDTESTEKSALWCARTDMGHMVICPCGEARPDSTRDSRRVENPREVRVEAQGEAMNRARMARLLFCASTGGVRDRDRRGADGCRDLVREQLSDPSEYLGMTGREAVSAACSPLGRAQRCGTIGRAAISNACQPAALPI